MRAITLDGLLPAEALLAPDDGSVESGEGYVALGALVVAVAA
jgi:hypothetical protein